MERTRVLILGAAGRDFHDFNMVFRDDPNAFVVGFTATQIPGIEGRTYPSVLAGPLYPEGLPIFVESDLERLIRDKRVDEVVLSYSDLAYPTVMHLAARALSTGAGFRFLSPRKTMLRSTRPVVAVTAVRTGCGKSQAARYIARIARDGGLKVSVIRHPMPYGDLAAQRVQRFASMADMDAARVTIEEREDYEPHVLAGSVVFAGVDYAAILARAEAESDLVLWDGGNNDLPFVRPDLWITVVDPHRPGHETAYHPGESNFRAADIVLVNKADSAKPEAIEALRIATQTHNPGAKFVVAKSDITVDNPELVRGKRVLVIEDGPTLTHGEMTFGAGVVAARRLGAAEVVDAHPYAVGKIAALLKKYPHIQAALPAVGYSKEETDDLQETVRAVPCDSVLVATPTDLSHVLQISKPWTRARYELADMTSPTLGDLVQQWLQTAVKSGERK
ncbi:MAG: GTPase [Polyangiaceae bacterium]|nr:GTPase [Polyangiaceae bacterium]